MNKKDTKKTVNDIARGDYLLYIIAIVIGMVTALVFGGSLSNLINFKFPRSWLIITAFLMQIVAQLATQKHYVKMVNYALLVNIFIYCLLFTGFWLSKQYFGINIISFGSGLNVLAILSNNGRMPVSYEALLKNNLQEAIKLINQGLDFKHVFINERTKVVFLTDIIQPPGILGCLMRVVSIGDLIIALGICVFIFELSVGSSLFAIIKKEITKCIKVQY